MALVSNEMIRSLVGACLRCRIMREDLLAGLPHEIVGALPDGDSALKQLFHALIGLNSTSWSKPEGPPPLLEALETAKLLAGARPERKVFDDAIAQLEAGAARAEEPPKSAFLDIVTRRMKQYYLNLKCHVTPPLDSPSGTFIAEDPRGHLLVMAIACREGSEDDSVVEAAIADVVNWIQVAREWGEQADGYVVLAPSGLPAERERAHRDRVREAGLHPVDCAHARGLRIEAIEAIVRRQLEERHSAATSRFAVVHRADASAADVALASFFRELPSRVLMLARPRDLDARAFEEEVFRVCAGLFLQHGHPAPLPIWRGWHVRSILDCACEGFTSYGEPVAPIALMPLLREGLVCPLLSLNAESTPTPTSEHALVSNLLDAGSERSKAVVVWSPGDYEGARRLERLVRAAGCEARLVRTVSGFR